MLAQVREPLLAVLRISPDFRPAYDPLLRMAGALVAIDVVRRRARCSPSSRGSSRRAPEAAQALRALDADALKRSPPDVRTRGCHATVNSAS